MARAQPTGRPIGVPTTQPGLFIAQRLKELGLPVGDFAARMGVSRTTVWRMLHHKTTYTAGPTLSAICDALELTGARRDALIRIYLQDEAVGVLSGQSGQHAAAQPVDPITHRERLWSTHLLRAFLKRHIAAANLTPSSFAHKLGVRPSTVTRLLRGESARTHRILVERVIDALDLEEVDRRRFLWLAFQAGMFAVTPRAAGPVGPLTRFERSLGFSLDKVKQAVTTLAERRNRGEVASAHAEVGELFSRLFDSTPTSASILTSPEVAHARLRVGFEYCEAVAAALPWYQRGPQMIGILDRMQQEVVQYFPPAVFASEYGHIVNMRAPLYRDLRRGRPVRVEYQESIAELTDGIEHSISPRAEPTLHIELLRNRAHTHLFARDAHNWRRDLEAAERLASGLRGEEGEQFRALVTYSWGEGYTYIVGHPGLAADVRERYAKEALARLTDAEAIFLRYHLWHGYALLAGIAVAECLVWSAPDESRRRLRILFQDATQRYPALTDKIARVARQADIRGI